MTLLNPIWLWGLIGLTIPLGIHLLSRKEGKTIRMGSIRFLTETSTSKFSSIRLNEVLLLVIRSLLIGLIILFLAGFIMSSENRHNSTRWVVVENGLETEEPIRSLIDSLQKEKYEFRRLAKDFPFPEADTLTSSSDYYALSEDLGKTSNKVIVLARNSLQNFKGKRVPLPDNISWISFADHSNPELHSNSPEQNDTLQITLTYSKDFEFDKKIILAALNTIQSIVPAKLIVSESEITQFKSSDSSGWLIWLSDVNPPPAGKLLRFKSQTTGDLIAQDNKREWVLTKRLNEANAVEQHLSVQLVQMLFSEQINQEINKKGNRTVADRLAWSNKNTIESSNPIEAGQPIDKVLIIIIALLFITERVFAFYRKQ